MSGSALDTCCGSLKYIATVILGVILVQFLKPLYYEAYAVTHPFHDNYPAGEVTDEPRSLTPQTVVHTIPATAPYVSETPNPTPAPSPETLPPTPAPPAPTVPPTPSPTLASKPVPKVHGFATKQAPSRSPVKAEELYEPIASEEAPEESALAPAPTAETACTKRRREMHQLIDRAQNDLFKLQHPQDCSRVKFLECPANKGSDQGTGSRLFFLLRCLTIGFDKGRTVVLNPNMKGTAEMLSPFLPWGNCTMKDLTKARGTKGRVEVYEPLGPDLTVVQAIKGGLVPKKYAKHGYFFWKAMEVMYGLRPTEETKQGLADHKRAIGWQEGAVVHGMQVRRTDKVVGKLAEAVSVPLQIYADELKALANHKGLPNTEHTVLLATDDVGIQKEALKVKGINWLKNPAAPKRTIGVFKGRVEKDAIDILMLRDSNILVFTYSSGFAALGFLLHQAKDGFCSHWASVDGGKREWPKWPLIGEGGYSGVPKNSKWASKLCFIDQPGKTTETNPGYPCTLHVKKVADKYGTRHLVNDCDC